LNLISKIFPFLHKSTSAREAADVNDELIGLWENDLDDGSGLHAIWGWSYRFNEDGSGVYYYWEDQELQYEIGFSWSRLTPTSIKAKFSNREDWTVIDYTIKTIDAPYSGKLLKLTDNNFVPNDYSAEGFWDNWGAIFKSI